MLELKLRDIIKFELMKNGFINKETKVEPKVKDILLLLGAGTFLAASMIIPGFPTIAKPFLDEQRRKKQKEWEKFNQWRLRQAIRRLEQQKNVEIKNEAIVITGKGKQKLLKFELDNIELKRKTDGKWRLIIYDIANFRKPQREQFRKTLKKLQFLKLQESVYITPFICEDEIEYLRQVFGIDREVQVLKVIGVEYEEEYKKYFGI